MSMPLKIESLHYRYSNGTAALNGVDFELRPLVRHGIIGPNGAGKSTLLQLITGILQEESGSVRVDGRVLEKSTVKEIRKKLGLLFQNSDHQLFSHSVEADVAFGPMNMGLSSDEVKERVDKALKTVGISHLADRAPHALSGGEKKSAALASVLSMDPEILLLDEPSAGLDSRSRRTLINTIRELPHAMIIVSHDLDLIWDTCTEVSVLFEGRIVETGDAERVLSDRDKMEKYRMELPLMLQRCEHCGLQVKKEFDK